MMETSGKQEESLHHREMRRNAKRPTPVMPIIIILFVISMVVGIVIRGKAPRGVCAFDHVYRRSVCRTKLLRQIPPEISDSVLALHIGNTLDKTENYFSVLEKSNFSRFTHLQDLSLIKCGIEEIRPGTFSSLIALRHLNLKFNRIEKIEAGTFSGIVHLESLVLSNNPISVLGDGIFEGLHLDHLLLENNPALAEVSSKAFDGAVVSTITLNRTNLRTIPGDTLAPLSQSLVNFTLMNNLQNLIVDEDTFKNLDLHRLIFANDKLRSFEFLKAVSAREVDLQDNVVEDFQIENSAKLDSIKKLSLARNGIEKIEKDALSLLISLEELDLAGNDVSIMNASVFDNLELLKVLDVSSNDIYDFDGDFENSLPNLKVLHLDNNDIQTLPGYLEPLFSRLDNLSLHGNPLHCNCEVRWLAKWIEGHRTALGDIGSVKCETPESSNFSQISDYGFNCKAPTIYNASFSEDGISLVCTAGGDPAPTVTWVPPQSGNGVVTFPLRSEKKTFKTQSTLAVTKDGNYTCIAENVEGEDKIIVNTRNMPMAGVKYVVESKEIEILETPQGFFITVALIVLLAYIIRQDSLNDLKDEEPK